MFTSATTHITPMIAPSIVSADRSLFESKARKETWRGRNKRLGINWLLPRCHRSRQ
jgi:hypothetical protein